MGLCNVVYFQLCISLMYIRPPFSADGYDSSHYLKYAECPIENVLVKEEHAGIKHFLLFPHSFLIFQRQSIWAS